MSRALMLAIAPMIPLSALSGCAWMSGGVAERTEEPPEPATIRFHLAADQPRPGWQQMTDRTGQTVYVAPRAALTHAGFAAAHALHNETDSVLLIVFNRAGSAQMRRLTQDNIGARMAVLINDELIWAPRIRTPASGQVRIWAGFSREEAEELAAALNQRELP